MTTDKKPSIADDIATLKRAQEIIRELVSDDEALVEEGGDQARELIQFYVDFLEESSDIAIAERVLK